jgi:hypothetical protein
MVRCGITLLHYNISGSIIIRNSSSSSSSDGGGGCGSSSLSFSKISESFTET